MYLLEGASGVGLVCTPAGGSGYLGSNIGLWGGDGVSAPVMKMNLVLKDSGNLKFKK